MTDQELTALAAMAYGNPPSAFSPLTDDGDALRLAVKLNLHVLVMEKSVFVHSDPDSLLSFPSVSEMEMTGGDPLAATRRAIVRAAAAMAPPAHDQEGTQCR